MKNTKHLVAVTILIILSTLGLRLLFTSMFRLPVAASAEAGPIDTMFNAHFWLIAFLFSLIMVIMLYAAFAFRRQAGDEEDAPHIHGNTTMEIVWTILPTIAVIGFGIWAVGVLNDLIAPKPNEMVIQVEAQQWAWKFTYPDYENASSSLLYLPVDQPVLLEMKANDVLHSFWVPEFRVKQDLVPGQTTVLRFTPTQEGTYKVRCAEICGTDHAKMLAGVEVMSTSAFADCTESEECLRQPIYSQLSPEERGQRWHTEFGCVACHTVDGTPGNGPTWLGLYGREGRFANGTSYVADDAYIREAILNPNVSIVEGFANVQMVGTFETDFATRQDELVSREGSPAESIDIVEDLIAFIKSLEE